ncbi:MAG TPA: hypothetical protein VE130_09320 [Nitrososphaeraceae archaeon]|jgi:hypothetical protein|nr:hypothetical protein [Nitrososphaeraceae archaeon]
MCNFFTLTRQRMVVVATMAVTLLGVAASASTGGAFAGGHKKYE